MACHGLPWLPVRKLQTDDRRVKHMTISSGMAISADPLNLFPWFLGGPAATGKFINMGNKKTDAWMDQDVSFYFLSFLGLESSFIFFAFLSFFKKQSSLFLTVGKPVKPPFFRHILRWCFCLEQLEVKHISGVIFPSKIEDFLSKHKSLKHILYHFVAFLSFFIASFPLDIRDAAGWLDLALGV